MTSKLVWGPRHDEVPAQQSERAKREQYRAANEKARLDRLHKQAKRQYDDAGDGPSDSDNGL